MKLRKPRKVVNAGQRGFTLLETAAASMIMLIGIMAVMQLFVLAKVYNKSATQTTMAATLAKRQMERLLALPLPPVNEPAPLGFGGQLGQASATTGYFENYYVDYDRDGQKGSMQFSTTPFFTGQAVSYVVTWKVEQDNVTVTDPVTNLPVPALAGLRRITVLAEATRAGLRGNMATQSNGQAGTLTPETAQLSTIRTPYN
jgi:prepilin-type N-terminal cleavage/methylation domain-containing protein